MTSNKIEKKSDPITTQLGEQVDAYHAALAYVRQYASRIEDLRERLDEVGAALAENTESRGRPPAKVLMDMSLAEIKELSNRHAQLEVERELLQDKQTVLINQLANTERNHDTFKNAADDAKRDIWVKVYEDRLGVLKTQHGELLLDLLALTNRLQKMPYELKSDLLPEGDADLSRIDRMAAEFGGLPL